MSGIKGKSGGARQHKGNTGGARAEAGRKPDGLKKIQPSVLPDTLETMKIHAARDGKGRDAKAPVFAAKILDQWAADKGHITGEITYSKELPELYAARRLQITTRVKKSTALLIFKRSLNEEKSLAAISGEVLDIWATRQNTLAAKKADNNAAA